MAKRIIILEKENPQRWRACFWNNVPAARQTYHANASATSQFQGATAEETGALQDGSIVERVDTVSLPPSPTLPQIIAALEARWQALQDEVDAEDTYTRYGSYWDGTSWIEAGA